MTFEDNIFVCFLQGIKLPSLLRVDVSDLGCETPVPTKLVEQLLHQWPCYTNTEPCCSVAACFSVHDG